MSKIYTDLNTVLTPYATAIKKNASDITSLNGSLDGLQSASKNSTESMKWNYEDGKKYVDAVKNLDGKSGIYYSIVQDLDGVQSSYTDLTAKSMSVVTITLSADNDIEDVTVLMGGDDISSSAYNANTHVITLNPVYGNVYIYARSEKSDIVTNGLLYHWVASDYDGGAAWTDRVSENNITLVNAVKDGKRIVFNSNTYGHAQCDANLNAQTLEVVYRTTSGSKYAVVLTPKVACGLGSTYRLLVAASSIPMSAVIKEYAFPKAKCIHTDTLSYTGTFESNGFEVYYNGEKPQSYKGSTNSAIVKKTSDGIDIGGILNADRSGINSYSFIGDIYEIRLYNRVLSENEVLTNLEHDNEYHYYDCGHPYDISDRLLTSAEGTKAVLRMMTYNVGHWYSPSNLKDVIDDAFRTQNADVIAMQETTTNATLESMDVQRYLMGYGYCYFQYCTKPTGMSGVFNNHAVMSKLFCIGSKNVVYSDIASEVRMYSKRYIKIGNKRIALYNTHLEYPNTAIRYAQMQQLVADFSEEEYFIVCGDLNHDCKTVEDADYINMIEPLIEAGYNVANCNPNGAGFLVTHGYGTQDEGCLDNIITSPNINITNVRVDHYKYDAGHTQNIDHCPLLADLEIDLV